MLPLPFMPAPQEVAPVHELIVSAPRSQLPLTASAAKVTVVSGEELERTGERSLPRALGEAAGVWIQESNLGGGAPVIRGLLGNQILILLDGVRLNDATTRMGPNQSLNTIDPAIVERVEIVRGSASVLYGSDAIGGVIAVWTRRRPPAAEGEERALHGAAELGYDSATDGGRASAELSGADGRAGWLGVVGAWDFGDLEAADGELHAETGYHGNSAFGSLDLALDPERGLRVTALAHRDFDVPRTFAVVPGFGQEQASFARYDFALQEREQVLLAYDDRADGGLADRMQLRLAARRTTERRVRRRTGSDLLVTSETEVETLSLGADWQAAAGERHLLTWGFDLGRDDVDSFTVERELATGSSAGGPGDFAPNARYGSFGAFVQDEVLLRETTLLTLGLRYSAFDFAFDGSGGGRERGDFDALTASAEAAQELGAGVRATATLAQGFQAPNLEDLANDGDFAGGTELANPELDPAESLMAELAFEVERDAWSGSAALFWTRIDDAIGRRLLDEGEPGVAGDELYLRANAGELQLWGAELSARRRLGRAGSPWSLEGLASWVRGRQYDDTRDPTTGEAPLDGVEARRIPPLHGRLALRWDRSEEGLLDGARLSLAWAAEQDRLHPDDRSDPRIDPEGSAGWAVLDLDLGGRLAEHVRWTLALVNLLDEGYRVHGSAIDGPGRSLLVGLRATF